MLCTLHFLYTQNEADHRQLTTAPFSTQKLFPSKCTAGIMTPIPGAITPWTLVFPALILPPEAHGEHCQDYKRFYHSFPLDETGRK